MRTTAGTCSGKPAARIPGRPRSITSGAWISPARCTVLAASLRQAQDRPGLLSKTNDQISQTFLYLFDANGNVGQLVDASDGSIAARYTYDPFGNLLVADGPEAEHNPFRFSTKYFDAETGLYYYGHRYYDPVSGRWPTRDPIGEQGGLNVYGVVGNDPINHIDPLGLRLKSGDVIRVKCGGILGIIAPDYGGTIYIQAY